MPVLVRKGTDGSRILNHSGFFGTWFPWAAPDCARYRGKSTKLNDTRSDLGFASAYHSHFQEELGQESRPTFYHKKSRDLPFHIDYGYSAGLEIQSVSVGSSDEWLALSDHMPEVVDFEPSIGA